MSVDMSKWCELAKANIHKRPAGEGRMAGKICIVTGAAQGFGKGIAEELYKEGATIVIADMNEPLAKQVAEDILAENPDYEDAQYCLGDIYYAMGDLEKAKDIFEELMLSLIHI